MGWRFIQTRLWPSRFLRIFAKGKIKVGYAYEFAPKIADGFGTGSHEIHVNVRLGKKQVSRPAGTTLTEEEPAKEKSN